MKLLPKNLEAIIFDLGGVVLNLQLKKTIEAFANLTGISQEKLEELGNNELFKHFETGLISADGFRKELNKLFGSTLDDKAIDKAWNAMLLDLPLERLKMMGGLRSQYKTFVLSNTNEIHIKAFNKIVNATTHGDRIVNYFNAVYYSHQVGMRKPDAEIFDMVLTKNSLKPANTLFIDDTLEHIESANRLGLHTWHLKDQNELFTVFGNG